jgi:hypothetical protein
MKTKYKTPNKGTVPKSNKKIVEKEEKSRTFLVWYRHFNKTWRG